MFAPPKLLPIKDWLYIGALVTLLIAFGWYTAHERGIGKAKCEAAIAAAQAQADAKADELQKRLDARAAEDAGLQAAAVAVAAPYVPIKFGCQLTPAELKQIRDRLK